MSLASLSTRAAAAGLGSIAVLHIVWAAGSSWPLSGRGELADAVVGREHGEVPPPLACLAVAAALASAAGLLAGGGRLDARLRALGARLVVGVLATRAAAGLSGRTDLLAPGSSSPRFRALDRRLYSPLCLTLAALALPATVRSGR